MIEQPNRNAPDEEEDSTGEQSKTPGSSASWRRFLTQKWIAILVASSIVVHGACFLYYCLARRNSPETPSPEVCLGAFMFEADKAEGGRLVNAEFSLSVALLEHVDQAARRQLKAHRFRVQQDVEELLRRAHGGDFDDPTLGDLKRQLQEQVNETLGIRAVADVIITNLKLRRSDGEIGSMATTAETVPWVEKPSG